MSATTYNYGTTSYTGNVVAAAGNLLKALFAVRPQAAVAAEPVAAQRNKASNYSWLNELAADCERHSPNLSAELRFMASRG